jgi:hypothetical protein
LSKVRIEIKEVRYHTVEIDLSAYDETVKEALETQDGEFLSDWCSDQTLDEGEWEFEGYHEVS